MDTEKLLRVLKNLQQDEQNLDINNKIQAIRTSVSQNNADGFTTAQSKLTDLLKEARETSVVYGYSNTETRLLEKVGGGPFFGKGLVDQLETIFNARSFEIMIKLDEYRNRRTEFIKNSQTVVTSLSNIGIKEYLPEEYEIGLVLPEAEADLDKLTRHMRSFKLLLSAISEVSGVEHTSIKITRLSNGSLDIFSLQPYEVAILLSTLLLNITAIWEKIAKFRSKMEETDKDELLSQETKTEIKKALKKETEKIKDEILEKLPEDFMKGIKKVDAGRKNEVRNQIRISVRAIFAWFEASIEIDITPIRIVGEPTAPQNSPETVAQIKNTNTSLRAIYELPQEIKKLPFSLPPEQEEETTDKKK